MANLKTYTWYLVLYFLPVLAVACGGRVEYDVRNSDPGADPTAPPMDYPSDPVPSDPPPFTGNDGGTTSDGGTAGSSGSGGSAGSAGSGGTSGAAGEAGAPSDGGTDADAAALATLDVHLSTATPPGMTMCFDVVDQPVLTFSLAAGSEQDVWSKKFRIRHTAAGAASEVTKLRLEFSNVYYTGILTDPVNGEWEFDTPGVFTAAGTSVIAILHASFNGTSGAQHAFEIKDAAAVTTVTPATVSGFFPVRGNTFTLTTDTAACKTIKLLVSSSGPPAGTLWSGPDQTMLTAQLTAKPNDLEIQKLPITIECEGGGMVKGSKGTPYFTSIAVKTLTIWTMATLMGPIEMPASTPNGATTVDLTFTDPWMLLHEESEDVSIVMNVAWQEDAPGELFGHRCRVTLKSLAGQYVKDMVYNFMLGTADVDVNTDIVGNWFTVQQGSLVVDLATTPISSIHVKKEQNVPTVGFTFTAGNESVTLQELTLIGQADHGGIAGATFGSGASAKAALSKDATVLCLYDGATIVGLCKAPDAADGKAAITGMNLTIPANSSKTLTVKASLASTIQNPAGDKFAIGIDSIMAVDAKSAPVAASVMPAVLYQANSAFPSVVQTIRPSGTLSIVDDSHPASAIVVGGKDVWIPFARYKACVQYEGAMIDRLSTTVSSPLTFDPADISEVGVMAQNASVIVPSSGTTDIDLSQLPIMVPKDGCSTIVLLAKVPQVVAWSLNPATSGVPRSGHAPALGLSSGIVTGEWDPGFAGNLNVRTTGSSSGEHLFVAAASATYGNPMVLRKSKPTVTSLPLASNVLANVDMDLFKFQTTPDAAGFVELTQFALRFEKSNGLAIKSLGIRKGATEMSQGGEVYILTDSLSGLAQGGSGSLVRFHMIPQAVSGPGYVFTVHGTLDGVTIGQSLITSFNRVSNNSMPITGKLEHPASGPGEHLVPFTGWTPDLPAGWDATFIWSDLSEGASHGWDSLDWTNDLYVQDLTQSQILVY